jgi:DNA replication protein DnaC
MPSSRASSISSPLAGRCLGCGREFDTEQVVVLGQTFAAERYCAVCRAAEEARQEQLRADARWDRVMVPTAYRECSFQTFEPVRGTEEALAACKQWVKEYRAGTRLRQGLFLHGRPGAGKTHLAVAVLREIVWSTQAGRALFLNVPDWLRSVRESFDEDAPPAVRPYPYDIVVLDDLGAEDWSDWARDQIYGVVNQREQQGQMLFVTSNMRQGELFNRIGSRMMSRLTRLTREVQMDTLDFREQLARRGAA